MSDDAARRQFLDRIAETLQPGATDAALTRVLELALAHFGCAVGTVHDLDPASGLLRLRAQRGIPDMLLPRVQRIPVGKGMAGIAAERREAVQVCNLQTDASGVAKPAAKDTRMEGSIAAPMLVGGELRGVLGVAKPTPYEFTAEETALLLEAAEAVGTALGTGAREAAP
ncbi:MAG TPA: GAF domain-containing protein [Gemmataceae bacterium]|nr:GAF domain-containing protein [Gemmataceae bacterium]